MALYALDALDDALDATRAFLTPVEARDWLKLAAVAFFVGGPTGGLDTGGVDLPAGGADAPPPGEFAAPEVGGAVLVLIAAAVVVVGLLALLLMLVGAIMEFVLVASLRDETVRLRRYWGDHWRRGVRLFAFRIGLGALTLAVVGVLGAVVALSLFGGGPGLSFAAALFAVPAGVVAVALAGLVAGFTKVFVVPIMLIEECGVLAGWRRLWPALRRQWRQFLAYAVAGVVLSVAGGILVGLAVVVGAVLLLLPFGIAGVAAFALFTAVPVAGLVLGGVVAVLFALALLALVSLAQVPVLVYLRYYALFVLGDADGAFDLIPERRTAVRSG